MAMTIASEYFYILSKALHVGTQYHTNAFIHKIGGIVCHRLTNPIKDCS